MKITVDCSNERLDKYLTEKLDKSRSQVQKIIKNGNVLKNGKSLNNNYLVNYGDELDVILQENELSYIKPFDIPLNIVYEDEYLLVINKQSGLVVHPAPGHVSDTLVNALVNKFKLSNHNIRPGIVHRIDKDTSGLLLVAKTDEIHDALALMIKNKEVERIYYALVEGVIKHDTGTIDAPIGRDSKNRQKMAVTDINGKNAITHFRVLKRFNNNTLVECKLETGRTHQIRVHFNYIGYPIVGDPVYGKRGNNDSFGQYLHSKSIRFVHPITKEDLYFESELPIEFKEKMDSFN
ncbi:MAG: RluA family pseudouridine synthase [bacterium]|nr:RluA family pseudouridine synthase [bacterium]